MPIDYRHDMTQNAMGGTELMSIELEKRLEPELLDKFQIIPSRVTNLDQNRKRILWAHDLPGDPASEYLNNGGYNHFEKIVFVSNWQMQGYISKYSIPWYKCAVIQNAINPIEAHEKPKDKIRLIYHTTPHRGLDLLYNAFDALTKDYDNLELEVFSSFEIYGWKERDEPYKDLFKACEDHPNIKYHGAVPNEQIREALKRSHIYGYPCVWPETSCLSLLEAMSAELICVHPNLAALPETAANWTFMYQWQQNKRDHLQVFYGMLRSAVEAVKAGSSKNRVHNQKQYIDMFYNWDLRATQWKMLLNSLA